MAIRERIPDLPIEPKEYPMPVCPCCGEECETVYRLSYGEIVGCEHCVDVEDAYDTIECNPWRENENL